LLECAHSAPPRAPVTARILDLNSERDDLRGKGELQGPEPRKREARALSDTWVRDLSCLTFRLAQTSIHTPRYLVGTSIVLGQRKGSALGLAIARQGAGVTRKRHL
jgi:hypothetical protein